MKFSGDEDYLLATDGANIRRFDWPSGELQGTLTPLGHRFVLIDAKGNYSSTSGTDVTALMSSFVYVVWEADRLKTYSPAKFEAKYGIRNDTQTERIFNDRE